MIEPLRRDPRSDVLGGLYEELRPALVRFAHGLLGSREDAEEAVQDAFAAALRHGPIDEPRLWLFRVTRNAAIDQLRRRRALVALELVDEVVSAADGPQAHAEAAEDLDVFRRGLARLPEQQRTALLLRELSGCSYREIAGIMDLGEANVKVLIFRARRALQDFALAVHLPCDEAQLALSARHDGEAGRPAAARARLHAAACTDCKTFLGSLRRQRTALASLVPLLPADHVAHAASHGFLHVVEAAGGTGAAGKGAIGGLLGLKGTAATAAGTCAAAVAISAGGVAVLHPVDPMVLWKPFDRPAKAADDRPATHTRASAAPVVEVAAGDGRSGTVVTGKLPWGTTPHEVSIVVHAPPGSPPRARAGVAAAAGTAVGPVTPETPPAEALPPVDVAAPPVETPPEDEAPPVEEAPPPAEDTPPTDATEVPPPADTDTPPADGDDPAGDGGTGEDPGTDPSGSGDPPADDGTGTGTGTGDGTSETPEGSDRAPADDPAEQQDPADEGDAGDDGSSGSADAGDGADDGAEAPAAEAPVTP